MTYRALLAASVIAMSSPVFAQTGFPVSPSEPFFLPPIYLVGDRVDVRFEVAVPDGIEVRTPRSLPDNEWVDLHAVEVDGLGSDRYRITISFTPFRPGIATLPPVIVGEAIVDGLRIQTTSILSSARAPTATNAVGEPEVTLQPIRPQLVPRGTGLWLTTLALALLLLPPILATVVVRVARLLDRYRTERRRAMPRLRLQRSMRQLTAQSRDDEFFYAELARYTRQYLQDRLDLPARSYVTREIDRELTRRGYPSDAVRDVVSILSAADLLKFARTHPEAEEREAVCDRVLDRVLVMEETERVDH